MDKLSMLDKASALSSGELSGEDDGFGILETAYIVVYDSRDMSSNTLSTSTTKSILSGLSESRNEKIAQNPAIKVQFNPAALKFSSGGAKKAKEKADISKKEQGETETASAEDEETSIQVSIKLVFDRTIYIDSSVQPEVERFLALVKNPFVRQIGFFWGKMCYKGVVKSIEAEYVLFNSLGIPTRAYVSFNVEIV